MLHFAYDGSLNGDWVAHYGVRLAAHHPERALRVLHVRDGSEVELASRLERIRSECERFDVRLTVDALDTSKSRVADAILGALPRGEQELLLCGARARPRNRAFLSGTVSERLLRAARVRTLCVRAVHPGVVGQPGRLLLPFAGHPRGTSALLPVLRLFDGDITRLHVLVVEELPRRKFRHLDAGSLEQLSRRAAAYVDRIEAELRAGLADWAPEIDSSVVVGESIAREIALSAGKQHSRLVLLGASERTLPERILHGRPVERVLATAPADVAIYRDPVP